MFADILILIFEPVNYFQCETFINRLKLGKNSINYFKQQALLSKLGILCFEGTSYFYVHPYVAVNAFPVLAKDQAYKDVIDKIRISFSSADNFYYNYRPVSSLRYLRQYILAFINSDQKAMSIAADALAGYKNELGDTLIYMLYSGKFNDLLLGMPLFMKLGLANRTLVPVLYFFQKTDAPENFIRLLSQEDCSNDNYLYGMIAVFRLYEGKTTEALEIAEQYRCDYSQYVKSICLMYKGEYEAASDLFYTTLADYRKALKKKNYFPDIHFGFFYLFLMIIHNPENKTKELELLEKLFSKEATPDDHLMLCLVYFAMGRKYEAAQTLHNLSFGFTTPDMLIQIFYHFVTFIVQGKLSTQEQTNCKALFNIAVSRNMNLMAAELGFILGLTQQDLQMSEKPIFSQFVRPEAWEDFLVQLEALSIGEGPEVKNTEAKSRLTYLVDFEKGYIQPVLQKRNNSGWSKGQNVAFKKFKSADLDCMTPQDLKITTCQQNYYDYYYDFNKMLPEIIGHPLLFLMDNPSVNVELVKALPELITEKTSRGYLVRCNVEPTEASFVLRKETNTRYQYIEITKEYRLLINTLKFNETIIPKKGTEKLSKVLSKMNGWVSIVSDLSMDENARTVEPDLRLRVQIIPVGSSLKAELFVKPFGSVPPYFKPGYGGKTVFGILENEKCVTTRDFGVETNHMNTFLNCLNDGFSTGLEQSSVIFDDPHDCLSLLEAVNINKDITVLEWPEGERIKFYKTVSFDQLKFKLNTRGNWFELEGEIRVDENTVLSLQQLLGMKSGNKNRFIEIRENEFIAFTDELRRRLNELSTYAVVQKKGIAISRFASDFVEELGNHAEGFKPDKSWADFRKKVKEADNLKIEVPVMLQTELRPYQEEGFRWMTRLAAIDAGACLADDMGLGKTIQSLAILLHRAKGGPGLVVCPASVVNNWVSEVQKFAPVINVKLIPTVNREDFFKELEPFDLVVTTYGVLQTAIDLIKTVVWETVILDEAHAIKNMATKSSKAAMEIKAKFRLILTGTPVQNHLGELWNLFNFINPGLLGSFQHFSQKFNSGGDNKSFEKQLLKKLIAPFILRRTKMNVLDELPPKTEITHKVELSDTEMAYYEALRRQAVLNIEGDLDTGGAKHLRALAEITKLRLACCNVALVDDTLAISSSKMDAFLEIVNELLENKHRALVFSQFVGHLALVRKVLDKARISYKYLDGSTSIPERGKIVNQFQKGEGDLFLISLKAGGLGLNLTAADYVIHLDPWWNPAIEDQASDRAHRIGQSRPVTIYRLVAKDTIEEKIIALHHSKRDMADSLLEGTDQASKLTANDLLNLIKEF